MGWKEIKPTVLGAKNHTCHVALAASSNGGGRRFAQWFELSFDVTNPDLAWLKLDLKVKVEIGERENAALLRITQNGPFKVCKTGGKSATRLRLRVPALPGQTAEKMKMTALTYRAPAGGGIVIDLPFWAMSGDAKIGAPAPAGGPFKLGAPSHADLLRGRK
jgi:hypothetical protein